MKQLELSVSYQEVMYNVHMTTAYEAKNTQPDVTKDGVVIDNDKFSAIATTESEEEILKRFWSEACSELMVIMREFDGFATSDADGITAQFDMPNNWDERLTGTIRTSVIETAVAIIASKWFAITLPTKQEEYLNKVTTGEAQLINGMCARLRPTQADALDNSQQIVLA